MLLRNQLQIWNSSCPTFRFAQLFVASLNASLKLAPNTKLFLPQLLLLSLSGSIKNVLMHTTSLNMWLYIRPCRLFLSWSPHPSICKSNLVDGHLSGSPRPMDLPFGHNINKINLSLLYIYIYISYLSVQGFQGFTYLYLNMLFN